MLLKWSISYYWTYAFEVINLKSIKSVLTPNGNLKSVGARLCGACTMVLQSASWKRDCMVKPEVIWLVTHGPKRKRVFPWETYGEKQHRVSIWATTKTGHFVNCYWPVTKRHLSLAWFELDDRNPWTRTVQTHCQIFSHFYSFSNMEARSICYRPCRTVVFTYGLTSSSPVG